ncbi:unnamed protein product [Adineta ricciae]|uniref:Uncharacterized protein n=1 Tax=Adineta ricciae TaxID=249248 RepID=A0A815Z674_ADIRI|nr:unnamed protein product [Adineta ricciae]
MASAAYYDPNEHLFSPSPDAVVRVLGEAGSPDFFDLSSSDSQSYTNPSQSSSNSSPPQSKSYSSSPIAYAESSYLGDGLDDSLITAHLNEKLRILAQPKAFYRERYCSETDPSKNRAQRFIRADDDSSRYEYPTIQIPPKWCDGNRDLYIRVTLVTIISEKVPIVCIHPYTIDTQEKDVLRDASNNSLYFPITHEEIIRGEKSFRISRKKMIQHDLRSYGPLRLLDLNQFDAPRTTNVHDAKQIIDTYQLWKSQLVFTVAERVDRNHFPSTIPFTSVTSQITCDEASLRRKDSLVNETVYMPMIDEETVICTPRKGDWNGGDDLLMTIPKLDRRKAFNIYFDYGTMGQLNGFKASFVDTKTIFLQTPRCAMKSNQQNLAVPLVVTQNDTVLARVEFIYLAPNKDVANICQRCQADIMNINNQATNKRRHVIMDQTEFDGAEILVEKMSQLTTEETPVQSSEQSKSDETNAKFDKYLNQLQEAVVSLLRTNDPSKLFRRTRLLISKCDQSPPPLDDAIRNGYVDLALRLVEQTTEMSSGPNNLLERTNADGQIPLLLAAKLNHWILMKPIVEKRLDLLEKVDNSGNNIFHLLADVSEDKAVDTIKYVLELIPHNLKVKLFNQKNQEKQTPKDIAQAKNHSHYVDLFNAS